MRFVLDASVALRWFLEEEKHPNADMVLAKLIDEPGLFAVPELFAYETFATLYRLHPDPLTVYIEDILPILSNGILRYPMTESIARRAHQLKTPGITGYDSCYLALAEEMEGVWLTFDRKAYKALRKSPHKKTGTLALNLWETRPPF